MPKGKTTNRHLNPNNMEPYQRNSHLSRVRFAEISHPVVFHVKTEEPRREEEASNVSDWALQMGNAERPTSPNNNDERSGPLGSSASQDNSKGNSSALSANRNKNSNKVKNKGNKGNTKDNLNNKGNLKNKGNSLNLTMELDVYQFKITLKGSKPPIWRRVQLLGGTDFKVIYLSSLHSFPLP